MHIERHEIEGVVTQALEAFNREYREDGASLSVETVHHLAAFADRVVKALQRRWDDYESVRGRF